MFGLMPVRRERPIVGGRFRPGYYPFDLLGREFASLFEPFFPVRELEPWGFEMEEKEGEVVVKAEVPGFEPTEIEVALLGNILTIRAMHKEPVKGEKVEPKAIEFERSMTLPVGINPEKVEALYRYGVLEVHVPLIPEAKPRHIVVKT
jgi:HSP20 family molecular chaperone IbpA